MSTPAQRMASIANAQASTGPRSEEGLATSSKNAIKTGLYAATDFIRPGEEAHYAAIARRLQTELVPVTLLEENLVDEILRAMWKLTRCAQIEGAFAAQLATGSEPAPDPMQHESAARLQLSVDRARAQSHRLLHKCTAELRKLQTERQYRNESLPAGTDIAHFGICDWQSISKALEQKITATARRQQRASMAELDAMLDAPLPDGSPASGSFCKTDKLPVQIARNSQCPCKSGEKYKRCCGKNAPAMLAPATRAA